MNQQQPQTIIIGGGSSQALPALVNAFCFPGLGQLIQGRVGAAFVWWIAHILAALSCLIFIGFILWPIVWVACIVDAARYNPMAVSTSSPGQQNPALLVVTGLVGFVVVASFFSVVVVVLVSQDDATQVADTAIDPLVQPQNETKLQSKPPTFQEQSKGADTPAIELSPTERRATPPVQTESKPPPATNDDQDQVEIDKTDQEAKFRTWTSANGKFQVVANLASFEDGVVTLERKDGVSVRVPLDQLSPDDQDFVKNRQDPRTRWLSESYDATFYHVEGNKWNEIDNKTGEDKWEQPLIEKERTPEHVILFNPKRNRFLRLSADRMEAKHDDQWKWIGRGKWLSQ